MSALTFSHLEPLRVGLDTPPDEIQRLVDERVDEMVRQTQAALLGIEWSNEQWDEAERRREQGHAVRS